MSATVRAHLVVPRRNPVFSARTHAGYTILCPQLAPIPFALAERVFVRRGFQMEVLPDVDRETVEEGLRYVNNDVCYPAVVAVGQLIRAIKSGKYDPEKTALMISQACGACRSTNYATFLRIAAAKAGFPNVPIVPFSFNVTHTGESEGITVGPGMLRELALAFLYGDLLMRLTNRCRPYEMRRGATEALAEKWIGLLRNEIVGKPFHNIASWTRRIVDDFEALPLGEPCDRPKVGIVGEILVKYHPGANRNLFAMIEREGGEVVVPDILDFVLYCFKSDAQRTRYANVPLFSRFKSALAARIVEAMREKVRKVLSRSRRFRTIGTIDHLAARAESLVSLCNHAGEGWLLTAEMIEMIETGTANIVCVQPFGCLPNHITGKGVLKALRNRFPGANVIPVDYDPGTTEVNQLNRIKLMMAVAQRNAGYPSDRIPETFSRDASPHRESSHVVHETVPVCESPEIQMSREP